MRNPLGRNSLSRCHPSRNPLAEYHYRLVATRTMHILFPWRCSARDLKGYKTRTQLRSWIITPLRHTNARQVEFWGYLAHVIYRNSVSARKRDGERRRRDMPVRTPSRRRLQGRKRWNRLTRRSDAPVRTSDVAILASIIPLSPKNPRIWWWQPTPPRSPGVCP